MSAYVCNPEHFAILAAYAVENDCAIYEWQHSRTNFIDTAQRIAKGLARENIRSVKHRYPHAADELPGPGLPPDKIEEAAAIYAGHFVVSRASRNMRPIQVFKLIQGLDYQSCETDDWPLTLAARQLDWIRTNAMRKLPGYEAADWAYDRKLPEVEVLYA